MSNSITVNSEPGKFPNIELQPGNTLIISIAGTLAEIIVNAPTYGFPSCEVISPMDHIVEHFAFIPTRVLQQEWS